MNFQADTTFADEDNKNTASLVTQAAIATASVASASPTKSGGKRKAVTDTTKLTLVSSSGDSGLAQLIDYKHVIKSTLKWSGQ